MRKLLIFAFFVCFSVAYAQRIPQINLYTGDPTGVACTHTYALVQSRSTGAIYVCLAGVYSSIANASGYPGVTPDGSSGLTITGGTHQATSTVTGNETVGGTETVTGAIAGLSFDSVVSVVGKGADPTGTNDSTAAFISALATGKSVHVPAGTYKIANPDSLATVLTISTAGQRMYGDGRDLSVLNYTGACGNGPWSNPTGDVVVLMSGANERVSDLTVQGPAWPTTCQATGIKMTGDHDTVEDNTIQNFYSYGVGAGSSTYALVRHNNLLGNHTGIGGSSDHITFEGNTVTNYWHTRGTEPWSNSTSPQWDGIESSHWTNFDIEMNVVEDNGQSGIYCGTDGNGTCSNGKIAYNTVKHNRNQGIDWRPDRTVVAGNVLVDNYNCDLYMSPDTLSGNITDTVVTSNYIEKTTGYSSYWSGATASGTPYPACFFATAFFADLTTTSGSNAFSVSTATGLAVGQDVVATVVPAGTTIATLSGTSGTLSQNATSTGTASNITFGSHMSNIAFSGNSLVQSLSAKKVVLWQTLAGSGNFNGPNSITSTGTPQSSVIGGQPRIMGISPSAAGVTVMHSYPLMVTTGGGWQLLGTWIAGGTTGFGDNLSIRVHSGAGFNTGSNQQTLVNIEARTASNASAPNLSGVYYWTTGGSSPITGVKLVDSTSSGAINNQQWDVYIQQASGATGFYEIPVDPLSRWVPAGSAASDPGTASSTVVVGTSLGTAAYVGLNNTFTGSNAFKTNAPVFWNNANDGCSLIVGDTSGGSQLCIYGTGGTSTTSMPSIRGTGGNFGFNTASAGGNFVIGNDRWANLNLTGHLNQPSVNQFAGTCTMSAATTCTFTLAHPFASAPICIATAQGATAPAGPAACDVNIGTSVVTITVAAAGSLTWGAVLIGNPN